MQSISSISNGNTMYYQNSLNPRKQFVSTGNVQNSITNEQKIGLGEGVGLFFKGIVKQGKDIVSAIFQHPIRTLAAVGGTTAALFALPLVGIPTAVGGAALALGFAGLATFNGAKHAIQFVKNNEAGVYDKARENLEQLGGDSVDLALSAPFVPKALKEIKNFAKYGKVAVNTQAIKSLIREKGLSAKWEVLKDANKEASRVINYNQAAEAELAKLQGITEAEKAKIKQYIKDYNVPREKIPEVVLEQWAKERGVATKPILRYQSLKKRNLGYAKGSECSITLNDFGDNIVAHTGNCNSERYQQVGKTLQNLKGDKYKVKFKDMQTGEIFDEIIDAKLVDDRNNLLKQSHKCSKEAQRILTTVHEREHIDQYARMYMNGDLSKITPQAEKLYQQMARDIGTMTTEEAHIYRQMARYNPKRRTVLAYTAEPMEVGARAKEAELLAKPEFKALDRVFKAVNQMKEAAISTKDYILNLVRAQSAAS